MRSSGVLSFKAQVMFRRLYIIDGFVGSETPRPTVVNGGAGGAASDEEQWGTFF